MSVALKGTLTNLRKTFEVFRVVIPFVAMGILLITGRKPAPALIMGLLIGIHIYLVETVSGVPGCSGNVLRQQGRHFVAPVQE